MVDGEWIPIAAFVMVTVIVTVVSYFWYQRVRIQNEGNGEYRRLAEEAVRGQRALLDEVERMNATLKEIERLLREV